MLKHGFEPDLEKYAKSMSYNYAIYRRFDRNQAQMFPEYLDNYINEENPVRVIDAFVDSLDLHKYAFTKLNKGGPGAPSYNPKDLLKLYIWLY